MVPDPLVTLAAAAAATQRVQLGTAILQLPLYEPAAREEVVKPIADRMAALLGWSAERRESELAEARGRLAADLTFVESETAAG